MGEVVDVSDYVSIHQVYARYGYVMDDKDWPALRDVFTNDCVFDATALGVPLATGFDEVRAISESGKEPLAHHVTNVFVESVVGDVALVRAKALGTYTKGRAFSGEYRDTLARTPDGWRIRVRTLRTPGAIE